MSEQNAEQPTGDTNVDADQVVVNNAPDGGGVDNAEPAAESTDAEGGDDSSE